MSRVFLSHTWTVTPQVQAVARLLRRRGWDVWFDVDDMQGELNVCMARGIDSACIVILFLTRDYMRKVDSGAIWDNCYKEYNYSLWSHKPVLPIVLDPALLDVSAWPHGILAMSLSSTLYIDGCTISPTLLERRITKRLRREWNLRPFRGGVRTIIRV